MTHIIYEKAAIAHLDTLRAEQEIEAVSLMMKGRFKNVSLISQSVKSMVCSANCVALEARVVIKKFFNEASYQNEINGYLLFRGGPIAKMLHQDPSNKIIVLERIEGAQLSQTRESLYCAIAAYARLHTQAINNLRAGIGSQISKIILDPCLADANQPKNAIDYQAVSVGDGKPGHLIFFNDQITVIDLETYSLTRSVWYDVLSLSRFLATHKRFLDELEKIVTYYCECREISSSCFDLGKIRHHLFAIRKLGRAENQSI